MASWKCARCSTDNDESGISCSKCGLMRGSVVIQGTSDGPIGTESIPVQRPTPDAAPASPTPWTPDGRPAAATPWTPEAAGATEATPAATPATTSADVPSWMAPSGELAPPVPAAPVPLWRRLPIGGIIFAVLLVGGGISSLYFGAARNDTGEIAKSGDLTANKLRVGDCYDLKEPDANEIEDVTAKPCTEQHQYELFFTGALGEGPYPAESVFEDYVIAQCDPAFATYVGKPFDDSTLDIYWLYPTDDSWRQGDRSVQCAVYDPKVERLTASLRNASR